MSLLTEFAIFIRWVLIIRKNICRFICANFYFIYLSPRKAGASGNRLVWVFGCLGVCVCVSVFVGVCVCLCVCVFTNRQCNDNWFKNTYQHTNTCQNSTTAKEAKDKIQNFRWVKTWKIYSLTALKIFDMGFWPCE